MNDPDIAVTHELKPWMCGAKTSRGTPCRSPKVSGKKRCYKHGGAAGSGRPPIHGLYSRTVREDPELRKCLDAIDDLESAVGISMREEIKTARARLLRLQTRDKNAQQLYHEALHMQAIDRLRRTEMQLGKMVTAEAAAQVMRLVLVAVVKGLRKGCGEDDWRRVWGCVRHELGESRIEGLRRVAGWAGNPESITIDDAAGVEGDEPRSVDLVRAD